MDEDLGYPTSSSLAEDYEFFGGFMPNQTEMIEAAVGVAASAGGILLTDAVLEKIDWLHAPERSPVAVPVAALAIGLIGGRALYSYNQPASFGFLGGVGGRALAELVQQGMAYVQAKMDESNAPTGPEGIGAYRRRRHLRGLAEQTAVTNVPPYYDRYKTSVPTNFRGLRGEMVSQANYFQTRGMAGLGEGEGWEEGDTRPENLPDEPGYGPDMEFPPVGSWITG